MNHITIFSSKLKKEIPFFGNYYNLIVLIIFITLSIILIIRHEFWCDEVLAWHLGSESHSLSQFINWLTHSYGHPFLWNLILVVISRFITSNMESMKVVSLTISVAIVYLFLKYAPFNKLIKVLFVFSYFIFYEYSIISRNYSLGVLCIIIFCILYKDKYKNLILLGFVLFFMGQANLYSFVISLLFTLILILDIFEDKEKINKEVNKFVLLIFFLIVLFGIILIYLQFNNVIFNGSNFTFSVSPKLSNIYNIHGIKLKDLANGFLSAFLPIPEVRIDFWNTNLIVTLLSNYVYLFSIAIFLISILMLKRRAIALFILGCVVISIIPLFIYIGYLRHYGHYFILFMSLLWLSNLENNNDKYLFNTSIKFVKTISIVFLIIILAVSVAGSGIASYYDYKYPFSSGKYVAQYIKDNYSNKNIKIIGYHDYSAETVAGYLNRDIYYPEMKMYGKFVNLETRNKNLLLVDAFKDIDSIINDGEIFLFVKDQEPITKQEEDKINNKYYEIKEVKFENSIVYRENFYLYEFIKSGKS